MKSRTLMWFIATTSFAVVAIPVQLAAQHSRYKLVDIPTFGGPAAYLSSFLSGFLEGEQVLSDRGMVVGSADMPTSDPNPSLCANPDCFVSHTFRWEKGVLTDLGALPGLNTSGANAINARGWVAGVSQNGEIDPLFGAPARHAVLWKDGEIIDLGTLGGRESFAVYVNNGGQVVGAATVNTAPDPFSFLRTQQHAFIWKNGAMHDLGTLGGPDSGPSNGCTNERDSLVAGASFTNSTPNDTTGVPTQHAFLWENGTMLDIPTLGGTLASAQCANNRGQVIGQSYVTGDVGCPDFCDQHAFFWDHGTLTDLGTLGGSFSIALWLNDEGEAVGLAYTPGDALFHATLWKKGIITDLGTLPGDCFSVANAINSKGQIVGQSISCDFRLMRAVLWDKGSIFDLNTLIRANSSLELFEADNINDPGQIAGRGRPAGCDDIDTCGHVFLLIRCDQPGAQGCQDNADVTARPNPTAITTSATTPTQGRHTTKEFVAKLRARLNRRSQIPGLGPSPRD